jgi:hypothetical protein
MTTQQSAYEGFAAERRWVRGILAGIAGFLVAGALSFGLLELVGPATVYNDEIQSPKLSAVWDDELWGAPRMMSDPISFAPALIALGAAQGAVFVLVAPALSPQIVRRGLMYGLVLALLSTLAFELLGPFNLLLEPIQLVAVEWVVGLAGNLVGGIVLSAIYGRIEQVTLMAEPQAK